MQEINLPRRQYTNEFKIEAIKLAESIGGHEACAPAGRAGGHGGQLEEKTSGSRIGGRSSAGRRAQHCSRAHAPPGDITYIATNEGWLYLAVVMDLASRRIVGWSMSESIDAKLVCMALRSA